MVVNTGRTSANGRTAANNKSALTNYVCARIGPPGTEGPLGTQHLARSLLRIINNTELVYFASQDKTQTHQWYNLIKRD